jgi:hypothetical protein
MVRVDASSLEVLMGMRNRPALCGRAVGGRRRRRRSAQRVRRLAMDLVATAPTEPALADIDVVSFVPLVGG